MSLLVVTALTVLGLTLILYGVSRRRTDDLRRIEQRQRGMEALKRMFR